MYCLPRCDLRDQLRDEQSYLSDLRRALRVLARNTHTSKKEINERIARLEEEIEIREGKARATREELKNGCANCLAYDTR